MKHIILHTGADIALPLFDVYLCALRGAKAIKFTVRAEISDKAVDAVFMVENNAPQSAFVAVYEQDATPPVSSKYGSPMGRRSDNLDHDAYDTWKARQVQLDRGGYDKGGAYWGLRSCGYRLFAVSDGMGNTAFIDAKSRAHAIEVAKES